MHNFRLGEIQGFWYGNYTVQRIDFTEDLLEYDLGRLQGCESTSAEPSVTRHFFKVAS
jgi:hypothetical protein